jgi:transposase
MTGGATSPQGAVTSLPGIGPILGAEFLVAAGDLSAFKSADRLAAYARLVPAAHDSGKRGGNNHRMRGGTSVSSGSSTRLTKAD